MMTIKNWHLYSEKWANVRQLHSWGRFIHTCKISWTIWYPTETERAWLGEREKRGWHCIVTCTSTRNRGQDLDPSNFHAWPLDPPKNLVLILDYSALTTPIDCLEIPTLTAWLASKSHLRLDCLTWLWPRSQVGVQSPMYVVAPCSSFICAPSYCHTHGNFTWSEKLMPSLCPRPVLQIADKIYSAIVLLIKPYLHW